MGMISDKPTLRFTKAAQVQNMLCEAMEDDSAYMLQGADKLHLGWMPFQMADFIAILAESVSEAEGISFLEVGSGIGTKSLVARELFGLTTFGIEYNETMATIAEQKGRGPVWQGDALTYPIGYNHYDIIWIYRPFRDAAMERALEERIFSEMKSGAILAGGHLEHFPNELGWLPVVDDLEARRGAWKKP